MSFVKIDADGVVIQKQPYAEEGFVEAPDDVIAGMVKQADGSFAAPEIPEVSDSVPFAVSSRQGQLALLDAGYLDDVELMIASIPDDSERRRAQIEFGATMWERSNPFLQQMWAGLGGDSAGLDDLFRAAIKL